MYEALAEPWEDQMHQNYCNSLNDGGQAVCEAVMVHGTPAQAPNDVQVCTWLGPCVMYWHGVVSTATSYAAYNADYYADGSPDDAAFQLGCENFYAADCPTSFGCQIA